MSVWTQLAAEATATDQAVRHGAAVIETALQRGLLRSDPRLEQDATAALAQLKLRAEALGYQLDPRGRLFSPRAGRARLANPRRRTDSA